MHPKQNHRRNPQTTFTFIVAHILLTGILSSPWHATDAYINPYYLGDYDALASDSTAATPGFLGAYGMCSLCHRPIVWQLSILQVIASELSTGQILHLLPTQHRFKCPTGFER